MTLTQMPSIGEFPLTALYQLPDANSGKQRLLVLRTTLKISLLEEWESWLSPHGITQYSIISVSVWPHTA